MKKAKLNQGMTTKATKSAFDVWLKFISRKLVKTWANQNYGGIMYEKIVFRLLISAVALLLMGCGDGGGGGGGGTTLENPADPTDPSDSNPTSNITAWVIRARGTSSDFLDVAYSGTRYVAVSTTINAISDDGVNWKLQSGSGSAITWGNGLFVLGGSNGVIKTSQHGITWTTRQSNCGLFCLDDFQDIVWSGSLFVAVGDSGMIYTSDDGVTWSKRDAGIYDATIWSVATSGSRFVIAAGWHEIPRYSDDGINWHETNAGFLNSVTWDGSSFIGTYGYSIYKSDDGVDWTNIGYGANEIVWDGSSYLGTGSGGEILKSLDLNIWEEVFHSFDDINRILPVAATGEYVVVGGEYTKSGLIVTSDDLETWHVRLSGRKLVGVVWDGDRFMAVDEYGRFFVSSDGVKWDSTYAIPDGDGGMSLYRGLAWSESLKLYVIVNDDILWSDDGINWTVGQSAPGAASEFQFVKWTGDQFVSISNDRYFYASADGKTWERKGYIEGMTTGSINDIAWSSSLNLFVAVSYGEVLTSSDGIDWTPYTIEQYLSLYSATWTDSQFVIVGSSGKIFTSPNGIDWTSRDSGTSGAIYAVSYDGGELLAANSAGQILSSADGITWTVQTTPTTRVLKAIAKSSTRAVAVGERGIIISRP